MHHDKALSAQAILNEDEACNDVFSTLLVQIEAMPAELRGAQALRFSAHLLELAAFELAGDVNSEQVGALIRCAAELADQSADVAAHKIGALPAPGRFLQ